MRMIPSIIRSLLSVLGVKGDQIFINDIRIDCNFFAPITLESEITEENIDATEGKIISTHVQKQKIEYEIHGVAYNLDYMNNTAYDKLKEYWDTKELINIVGSEFDDKDFTILNINKIDEGINFVELNITLKELEFVQAEEFEYDATLQGRAENGKTAKKGTAKKGKGKAGSTGASGGGFVDSPYGG